MEKDIKNQNKENEEIKQKNKIDGKNQVEEKIKKSDLKNVANKAAKKKSPAWWVWPIKILVITIFLSLAFSVLSEFVLSSVGIAISILIIVLLLFLGISADMVGVAATACQLEPFTAMRSRKVRGAKVAMSLVKNAEKVSSICNDVIGDICGILSGAAGAAITFKLANETMPSSVQIIIAACVSALIAGLTIFGKAICKKYAMDNSTKIILNVGKVLSIFSRASNKKAPEKVSKENKVNK